MATIVLGERRKIQGGKEPGGGGRAGRAPRRYGAGHLAAGAARLPLSGTAAACLHSAVSVKDLTTFLPPASSLPSSPRRLESGHTFWRNSPTLPLALPGRSPPGSRGAARSHGSPARSGPTSLCRALHRTGIQSESLVLV